MKNWIKKNSTFTSRTRHLLIHSRNFLPVFGFCSCCCYCRPLLSSFLSLSIGIVCVSFFKTHLIHKKQYHFVEIIYRNYFINENETQRKARVLFSIYIVSFHFYFLVVFHSSNYILAHFFKFKPFTIKLKF